MVNLGGAKKWTQTGKQGTIYDLHIFSCSFNSLSLSKNSLDRLLPFPDLTYEIPSVGGFRGERAIIFPRVPFIFVLLGSWIPLMWGTGTGEQVYQM